MSARIASKKEFEECMLTRHVCVSMTRFFGGAKTARVLDACGCRWYDEKSEIRRLREEC